MLFELSYKNKKGISSITLLALLQIAFKCRPSPQAKPKQGTSHMTFGTLRGTLLCFLSRPEEHPKRDIPEKEGTWPKRSSLPEETGALLEDPGA